MLATKNGEMQLWDVLIGLSASEWSIELQGQIPSSWWPMILETENKAIAAASQLKIELHNKVTDLFDM